MIASKILASVYPPITPSASPFATKGRKIPLWVSAPTYVELGNRMYVGRAFEVPHLNRVVHTVHVDGLQPDSVYEFCLPDKPTALYTTFTSDPSKSVVIQWQTETPFFGVGRPDPKNTYRLRTLPETLDYRDVRLLIGGDIYQSTGQLGKLRDVFDVIAYRRPDIFVIGGDIAYADNQWSRASQWHVFWNEWMKRTVNPDEPITPIVAAIGNHEIGDGINRSHGYHGTRFDFANREIGENTWFAAQFAFPQNGAYGVIDVGNYLSLVVLDTEHASPPVTGNDEQTQWLRRVVADRTGIPHVIPIYHVATYPANRNYYDGRATRIRSHWHPIFERHGGIKVAFEFHDHVYKRTVPILHVDGVPQEHPDGIIYLGDGALGVTIRDAWNPFTTWYLEDAKGSYYVRAQSGDPHPLDGEPGYTESIDEAWHMFETTLSKDKRVIRTINMMGDGKGTVYHKFDQEV